MVRHSEKCDPSPSWRRLPGALYKVSLFVSPKGVILSAIVSTDPQKPPFLLILDAKSFTELARASVDVEIHLDLHGVFIPDTDWVVRQ